MRFHPVSEAKISRAIIGEFMKWLDEYVTSDVIIIGGGPSGLMAAKELAEKNIKTLVVESNNYLGGGFWIGGYLMNTMTFRAPAQEVLDELNISYKEADEGIQWQDQLTHHVTVHVPPLAAQHLR